MGRTDCPLPGQWQHTIIFGALQLIMSQLPNLERCVFACMQLPALAVFACFRTPPFLVATTQLTYKPPAPFPLLLQQRVVGQRDWRFDVHRLLGPGGRARRDAGAQPRRHFRRARRAAGRQGAAFFFAM
jgi:hypothetical protein